MEHLFDIYLKDVDSLMGTSALMIDQHYGQVKPQQAAKMLSDWRGAHKQRDFIPNTGFRQRQIKNNYLISI